MTSVCNNPDVLHLFVYPVALGSGLRLFPDGTARERFTLAESETYANGVLHLAYAPQSATETSPVTS